MKWNDFSVEGIDYDLTHLHPFEMEYIAPASPKRPERTYKFHVNFSMHCFTRSTLNGEQVTPEMIYTGPSESRAFCTDRYQYSIRLPEIVRGLGERTCWHTHHGNYFTIEIVNQEGEIIEYEVYFDITRSSRRGWLNLIVESAYVRSASHNSNQPGKRKIRLSIIAYNTLMNRRINPGR